MRKIINLSLFAVGATIVVVNAQYNKSPAKYNETMECANCIRSGNDFCIKNVAVGATT